MAAARVRCGNTWSVLRLVQPMLLLLVQLNTRRTNRVDLVARPADVEGEPLARLIPEEARAVVLDRRARIAAAQRRGEPMVLCRIVGRRAWQPRQQQQCKDGCQAIETCVRELPPIRACPRAVQGGCRRMWSALGSPAPLRPVRAPDGPGMHRPVRCRAAGSNESPPQAPRECPFPSYPPAVRSTESRDGRGGR